MTAQHLFTVLFNAGTAISVGATVAFLGMSFTVQQLVAPLRRVALVVAMVVVNVLVFPAIAWGSPRRHRWPTSTSRAWCSPPSAWVRRAPSRRAQLAKRADLPLAVSLVVVLQLVDIVAVPVWAGQVVSGASISGWDIVKDLLLLVLAPLAIGLILNGRYPDDVRGWQPGLVRASNLALVVALTTGVAVNWATIVTMFGSWVIETALGIVVVGLVGGALLGGRVPETRTTTTLVTGMRFASLGLIIIGTRLEGASYYIGPAITFALVSLILPMLVAAEIGRKEKAASRADLLRPKAGPA